MLFLSIVPCTCYPFYSLNLPEPAINNILLKRLKKSLYIHRCHNSQTNKMNGFNYCFTYIQVLLHIQRALYRKHKPELNNQCLHWWPVAPESLLSTVSKQRHLNKASLFFPLTGESEPKVWSLQSLQCPAAHSRAGPWYQMGN